MKIKPIKYLLRMVTQEPLNEKPEDARGPLGLRCPFCGSCLARVDGESMTLVSDDNHVWQECHCDGCRRKFTREYKEGRYGVGANVWYTEGWRSEGSGRVLLRGIPSCFEDYAYACRCGGSIRRSHRHLDGISEINGGTCTIINANGDWKKQYRIFFRCDKCGDEIETDDDHWYPGVTGARRRARRGRGKLRLGWTIYEEPGVVVANDQAIGRINVEG